MAALAGCARAAASHEADAHAMRHWCTCYASLMHLQCVESTPAAAAPAGTDMMGAETELASFPEESLPLPPFAQSLQQEEEQPFAPITPPLFAPMQLIPAEQEQQQQQQQHVGINGFTTAEGSISLRDHACVFRGKYLSQREASLSEAMLVCSEGGTSFTGDQSVPAQLGVEDARERWQAENRVRLASVKQAEEERRRQMREKAAQTLQEGKQAWNKSEHGAEKRNDWFSGRAEQVWTEKEEREGHKCLFLMTIEEMLECGRLSEARRA
eukprot:441488-Pelagomonas_calceolata.AAC.3